MSDDITQQLRAKCIGRPASIQWPHRLLHDAANHIEKLHAELLHSQARETEYQEGFEEGWKAAGKANQKLAIAARDMMKTVAGLVSSGQLELKSTKEAGEFLSAAFNRVEECLKTFESNGSFNVSALEPQP